MTVAQCVYCEIWNDLDVPDNLMNKKLKSWCRRCNKIAPHRIETVTKLNKHGHREAD